MSSGAESDDSCSGPDSPSVVLPLQQQQQQLSRPGGGGGGILEPNGLQGLEKHANGNSSSSGAVLTAAATGGVSIRMSNNLRPSSAGGASSSSASASAINLAGLVGTLSRLDGLISDIPSGLYPASAFQHIPPEIVLQLVEMGHLKFHSNEGKEIN